MSLQVTLILTGVNIPGMGLLREARWDSKKRQWILPPLESTRVHGLEVTQTERRFEMVEMDRFRYGTSGEIEAFTDHLRGIENHMRLMNARPGALTGGTMPEYLFRRCDGVAGILGRLISDGAQEAMDNGREALDEALLDGIVIGRQDRPIDSAGDADPPGTGSRQPRAGRRPGRNAVFDDRGPSPHTATG
ncbi:hypothetical protein [Streptomyces sp. NPDC059957]|uniref:hypothetical protein n=1 Tax=unclassified Streptomyces TaxID=2593676 RepID=UPI0036631907